MSRDQVGALQATWQALEDAGIPAHALYKTRYVDGPLFHSNSNGSNGPAIGRSGRGGSGVGLGDEG